MKITESQHITDIETEENQRAIDMVARKMPDSRSKRVIQSNLGRLHKAVITRLTNIADDVQGGEMTVDQASATAVIALTPIYDAAIRQGYINAGTPDWEHTKRQEEILLELVSSEVTYFVGFMQDLEGMSKGSRLAMYGGGSEAAYWRGFISMLPSNAQIDWRLGIAESCPDCLRLASKSPYTKPGRGSRPLRTVPRGGVTRCLKNCKCNLVSTGVFEASLLNLIGVEVVAIGALAMDPTTPAANTASLMYLPLTEDYAYLRRRAYLETGSIWGGLAAAKLGDINSLAESMNHTVRLRADDDEILDPVRFASRKNMEYVRDVSIEEDLVGLFVAILITDRVERGKITSVVDTAVTLEDDPERTFRIDRQGRAILFVER